MSEYLLLNIAISCQHTIIIIVTRTCSLSLEGDHVDTGKFSAPYDFLLGHKVQRGSRYDVTI